MNRDMARSFWCCLILAACLSTRSKAEKDDNYFSSGARNPNSKKAMYWRDARNVLQDLAEFQSLSVRYHSCAWSELAPDNDGQSNDNNNNDDEYGAFCNTIDYGDGDDENNAYDWWYLGKTTCNRANVAFSLYGTLIGESSSGGCRKSTYINSFFTNAGVEPFLAAMQSAGVSDFQSDDIVGNVDSRCQITKGSVYNDDGVYYRDDDAYEYFAYGNHNEQYFTDMYSRSLFCTKRGKFVKQSFGGPFCEAQLNIRTTDNMNQLNSALSGVKCVEIYNVDSVQQEGSGDHNDNDDEYDGALSLLEYSQACSLRDPSGACPDPHGKLGTYSRALERVTKGLDGTLKRRRLRHTFCVFLILISLALVTLSSRILMRRCMRKYPSLRKRFGKHRIANALKVRRRRRRKKGGEEDGDGLRRGASPTASPRSSSSKKKKIRRKSQQRPDKEDPNAEEVQAAEAKKKVRRKSTGEKSGRKVRRKSKTEGMDDEAPRSSSRKRNSSAPRSGSRSKQASTPDRYTTSLGETYQEDDGYNPDMQSALTDEGESGIGSPLSTDDSHLAAARDYALSRQRRDTKSGDDSGYIPPIRASSSGKPELDPLDKEARGRFGWGKRDPE